MRLELNQDDLRAAVAVLEPAMGSTVKDPMTDIVSIRCLDGKVILKSTNRVVSARWVMPVVTDTHDGRVLPVEGAKLVGLVKRLESGTPVVLEPDFESSSVDVSSGAFRATLRLGETETAERLEWKIAGLNLVLQLRPQQLRDAVETLRKYSVPQTPVIDVTMRGAVAGTLSRLGVYTAQSLLVAEASHEFAIPTLVSPAVLAFAGALAKSEDSVGVYTNQRHVVFVAESGAMLSAPRALQRMPECSGLIDAGKFVDVLELESATLSRAIARISVVASSQDTPLRMSANGGGELEVSVDAGNGRSAVELVPVRQHRRSPLVFDVRIGHMLALLSRFAREDLVLQVAKTYCRAVDDVGEDATITTYMAHMLVEAT